MGYSTVRYIIVWYSTVQYSTVLYSTLQYSTVYRPSTLLLITAVIDNSGHKCINKQAGADLYRPAPIYHRPNGSGCVSGYRYGYGYGCVSGYGYGYGYGCVSVDVYVYHRPNLERARKGRLPLVILTFSPVQ